MTTTHIILRSITAQLESKIEETTPIGLHGKAAIVLYYFYYYKFSKEEIYADKGISLLQDIIGGIDAEVSVNLYDGIAGIGWLLGHLNENGFVTIDIDTSFAATFDDHLYEHMSAHAFAGNFDYHTGVLGCCVYFIKRYQNTKSVTLKSNYKNYITQVIFFMENQRITKKFESQQFESDSFDLHSALTNTVNFLLFLLQEKTFDAIVKPLLNYYTQLLFKRVLKDEYHKVETILCLWKSGNKLGNSQIKEKATLIFDENRFDEKSIELTDLYKRYQSYNYLYQQNKNGDDAKMRDLYQTKFNSTLKIEELKDKSVSLWNGLANIGLSLITLENEFPITWDECVQITTKK